MLLVVQDDAIRESAHGPAAGLPDAKVGTFTQALMEEAKRGKSETRNPKLETNLGNSKSEASWNDQLGESEVRSSKQVRIIEREENSERVKR
jgi:hypothetical protein